MTAFDREFVFDEDRQKEIEQLLDTDSYHFAHKYFDFEYWLSDGLQVRRKDNVVQIFVLIESEGKVIYMVRELNDGTYQK